jgi:hypothetical protein
VEERFGGKGLSRPGPDDGGVSPLGTVIAKGLVRFAAVVAAAAGVSIGVALAVAWWRDSAYVRAAVLGLYLGGAALIAVPVFSWGGRSYSAGGYEYYEVETDPAARRAWQSRLGVYVAVGLAVIGLGFLLEIAVS